MEVCGCGARQRAVRPLRGFRCGPVTKALTSTNVPRAQSGMRRRAMQSEHSNFARVYDEHVWRVYGFLAYRLGDRDTAEDLTQATFERALRAWARFDPRRASESTWLLAIARNLLIDHYRRDRSNLTE